MRKETFSWNRSEWKGTRVGRRTDHVTFVHMASCFSLHVRASGSNSEPIQVAIFVNAFGQVD